MSEAKTAAHLAPVDDASLTRLAHEYLSETGFAPAEAVRLDTLWNSPTLLDTTRLTAEEAEEYRRSERIVNEAVHVTALMASGGIDADLLSPQSAPNLGPSDIRAIEEAVTEHGQRMHEIVQGRHEADYPPQILPDIRARALAYLNDANERVESAWVIASGVERLRDAFGRYHELYERIAVVGEERERYLADAYTRDGQRQPALTEWLRERGRIAALLKMYAVLERLGREQAEREREEERRLKEEIQQQNLDRDRMFLPAPIRDQWKRGRHQRLQDRIESKEVAIHEDSAPLLEAALQDVNSRELLQMEMPEIRAMAAALSFLREEGDTRVAAPAASVPWKEFCKRADVDPRQPKLARELLGALGRLSTRALYFEFVGKNEHGHREVAVVRTPMFNFAPRFRVGEETGEKTPAKQWAKWMSDLMAHGHATEPAPWKGALPSAVTINFPDIVRQLEGAAVLSIGVLRRMGDGAEAVRGSRRLTPMDWSLFVEILLMRQERQYEILDDAGPVPMGTFWSYVDVDAFLRAQVGEDDWNKQKGRHREAFRKSANVLLASELILKHEPGYKTKNGPRDRFLPNPKDLHGLSSRALGARQHAEARAEAKAEQRRITARKRAREAHT